MATGALNKGYVAHYGVTHVQRWAGLITYTRLSVNRVLANQSRALPNCAHVHVRHQHPPGLPDSVTHASLMVWG